MIIKKSALYAIVVFCLTSCATYERVESNTVTRIGPLGVTPSQEWNSVPKIHSIGDAETWTANGTILDSVAFFVGLENGKPLMKGAADQKFPQFKEDMLPHEIIELVQSSYAIEMGASITGSGELQPTSFGDQEGFEFVFDFVTPDELKRRAFVTGTVYNGRLFVVAYQAAALHYYDKHLPAVKKMLATAVVE